MHFRRLLKLVRLYGRQDVLAAIALAQQHHAYDAAYVENLLWQERRRRGRPVQAKKTSNTREPRGQQQSS